MSRLIRSVLCCALMVAGASTAPPAHARIVIEGNRVIYPESSKEVTVRLKNNGDHPALAQVWVDDYEIDAGPEQSKAPFTALPPLVRVEPHKGQVVRIRRMPGELPHDRESVFWLNVLDLPGSAPSEGGQSSQLQIAVRNRIKVFYRPAQLQGAVPGMAVEQLQWALVPEGAGWALQVRNDSPFHISAVRAWVMANGKAFNADDVGIVKPKSVQTFPVPSLKSRPGSAEVKLKFVNEFGGAVETQAPIKLP